MCISRTRCLDHQIYDLNENVHEGAQMNLNNATVMNNVIIVVSATDHLVQTPDELVIEIDDGLSSINDAMIQNMFISKQAKRTQIEKKSCTKTLFRCLDFACLVNCYGDCQINPLASYVTEGENKTGMSCPGGHLTQGINVTMSIQNRLILFPKIYVYYVSYVDCYK